MTGKVIAILKNILARLIKIPSFLRGDYIVIMQDGDSLVVDCGNSDKHKIKSAASVFFQKAYNMAS